MMRVFVKYFYVSTFRVAKAERAFIYGVKQGGVSLAKVSRIKIRPGLCWLDLSRIWLRLGIGI